MHWLRQRLAQRAVAMLRCRLALAIAGVLQWGQASLGCELDQLAGQFDRKLSLIFRSALQAGGEPQLPARPDPHQVAVQ